MNTENQHHNMTGKAPAGGLHRDPDKAMQQMMESIDQLRSVYEDETNFLLKADTRGFLALQDIKSERALRYEAGIKEILLRKDEMRAVDPDLKRKLNRMQRDFSALSEKNKEALERMSRTMERLGHTLRHAAKEEVKKNRIFSYGARGQIESTDKKHICISLSEEA